MRDIVRLYICTFGVQSEQGYSIAGLTLPKRTPWPTNVSFPSPMPYEASMSTPFHGVLRGIESKLLMEEALVQANAGVIKAVTAFNASPSFARRRSVAFAFGSSSSET